ncbi:hypothetical protein CR513_07787, partial [Mucuna pruriens]
MTINAVPAQGTPTHPPGYAPQPYEMPYGENTNTEDQQECQRQEQAENFGGGQIQGQRTIPRATVYYHLPQNLNMTVAPPPISNEKLSSLEERLRAIEDMAPDRSRLQNMSKKESEGFKDYA